MSKTQICQDCDDMTDRVTYDSNDQGFQVMSDDRRKHIAEK